MTATNSPGSGLSDPVMSDMSGGSGRDDQVPVVPSYGHGRMPWFLKLAWLAFLSFIAWYVTVNLLPALGTELGG